MTIILFMIYSNKTPAFRPTRISPIIKSHLKVMKKLQTRNQFALTRAFVIGDKKSLTKKLKETFNRLHLVHLFTPSGIHFSSFYMFFIPLFAWLKKRKRYKTKKFLEVLLCTLPFFLNKFYSLKRISLLRVYGMFTKSLKLKIDIYQIFLGTFLIDYLFGTFDKSPMSFTFSFLFLGSLLSAKKFESRMINFLCANLLISFLTISKVNIIGFVLGFFTTAIFSLLFPLIFVTYWPSSILEIDLSYPFVYIIELLTNSFSTVSNFCPFLSLDFFGLLLLIVFIFKRKVLLLVIAVLISSETVYNLPKKRLRKKENHVTIDKMNWKVHRSYEVAKNSKRKCKRLILRNGHLIRCKELF
ncbi:hypothetical protein A9Q84_19490 [Halobacteriovorax marinus]|uniref:ComEC/Rec2-related protein domain-containing protein n=1 Tax=Halobacteriovorax marinus TaxID=97084 RepID=A0A1Y5F344_9BACT|nr:hypothetical protein A9Q84_19490 [Halobacteriovorax marinus]